MMRQAGRYLPEYRKVRERADFLTMCTTPELAVEVTLQPVDIMGVDAAIIFSDILVVPQAMGLGLSVDEGVGPRFHSTVRSRGELAALRDVVPEESLAYMLDALRLARRELDGRVPLIGFAGAPWTLASYMIEGQGTKTFAVAKRLLAEEPALAHALLEKLAVAVGAFLVAQVRAGAQVVQLFDSWAGALAPRDWREFGLRYITMAVRHVRHGAPGTPVIVFAPGAGWALEEIVEATGADVLGVDWHTEAQRAGERVSEWSVALQGNFDPTWLYAPIPEIERRTGDMLRAFSGRPHIANLGHGILPDTPVAHARAFIDTVKAWRG
jgi:uroporphyrinogen decarboxylase